MILTGDFILDVILNTLVFSGTMIVLGYGWGWVRLKWIEKKEARRE